MTAGQEGTSRSLLHRWTRGMHVLAVVVAVALVATTVWAVWPDPPRKHLTAHFPRTVGLYEGSDVRVLGVPIGTVDKVTPEGTTVRVEMSYEAKYDLPADARAVIISPSIVSDRYVQLTPAYKSGPKLPDGYEIPQERTATPVELDRIYTSLDDLAVALGPEGANRDGELSRLLRTAARNLDGQGENMHKTVEDLADASGTLANGREDLFATVRQLEKFTEALAESDQDVREFNSDLEEVAAQLSGERHDLQRALDHLALALTEVHTFVRDNRGELRANVDGLTELSKTLVKQQDALREILDTAPVALANLDEAYNPQTGTLDTRDNFAQLDDPGLFLCTLLLQTGEKGSACGGLRELLELLPDLPELPGGELSEAELSAALEEARRSGSNGTAKGEAGSRQEEGNTTTTRDLTLGGILPLGAK